MGHRFVLDGKHGVEEPVIIIGEPAKTRGLLNTNRYYGEDEEELVEDSLSFLERGHIYHYYQRKGEDQYQVISVGRLYDEETRILLAGLESFSVQAPMQSFGTDTRAKRVTTPTCCLQNFSLSNSEMETFIARVENHDGVVKNISLSLTDVQSVVDLFASKTQECQEIVIRLRNAQANITTTTSRDLAHAILASFSEARDALAKQRQQVTAVLNEFSQQQQTAYSQARVQTQVAAAMQLATNLFSIDVPTELIRINSALGNTDGVTGFGTLRDEIACLKKGFPQLSSLSVIGTNQEELVVRLQGLALYFSASGVRAEGDPLAVYPYLGLSAPQTEQVESLAATVGSFVSADLSQDLELIPGTTSEGETVLADVDSFGVLE